MPKENGITINPLKWVGRGAAAAVKKIGEGYAEGKLADLKEPEVDEEKAEREALADNSRDLAIKIRNKLEEIAKLNKKKGEIEKEIEDLKVRAKAAQAAEDKILKDS